MTTVQSNQMALALASGWWDLADNAAPWAWELHQMYPTLTVDTKRFFEHRMHDLLQDQYVPLLQELVQKRPDLITQQGPKAVLKVLNVVLERLGWRICGEPQTLSAANPTRRADILTARHGTCEPPFASLKPKRFKALRFMIEATGCEDQVLAWGLESWTAFRVLVRLDILTPDLWLNAAKSFGHRHHCDRKKLEKLANLIESEWLLSGDFQPRLASVLRLYYSTKTRPWAKYQFESFMDRRAPHRYR